METGQFDNFKGQDGMLGVKMHKWVKEDPACIC